MPQPVARGAAADSSEHCARCGVAVTVTRHTRTDAMVGSYRLHGGPTEAATLALDDDATVEYRRLVRPVLTVVCPGCFVEPEVRALWDTWGEESSARPAGRRDR